MKNLLRCTFMSLALGGAMLIVTQPVQAASCAALTATVNGLAKTPVSKRAEAKLKRTQNRWARKEGVKTIRVSNKGTSCSKGKGLPQSCTAAAYVCK